MHEQREMRVRAGGGVLEHLLVAVGIAEGEDRPAADVAIDADRLAGPSSTKSIFGWRISTGWPLRTSYLTTWLEPIDLLGRNAVDLLHPRPHELDRRRPTRCTS